MVEQLYRSSFYFSIVRCIKHYTYAQLYVELKDLHGSLKMFQKLDLAMDLNKMFWGKRTLGHKYSVFSLKIIAFKYLSNLF